MEKTDSNIKSLDTALDIIEFLYLNGKEIGINEISRALNMHKSTVFRMLNTMKKKGYIHQNASNSKYSIGSRFYSIGLSLADKLAIFDIMQPYAWELSKKYNECVHAAVPDFMSKEAPRQISVLKANDTNSVLNATPSLGVPYYSHCSASGKVLMAYLGDNYINRYKGCELAKFTENTITDWSALENELKKVKEYGYAIDKEELEIGLTCVAVPMLSTKNEVIGAVSMMGSTFRLKSYDLKNIVSDLQQLVEVVVGNTPVIISYEEI
jgi:DNA-binding IclR family transcriptional regulator